MRYLLLLVLTMALPACTPGDNTHPYPDDPYYSPYTYTYLPLKALLDNASVLCTEPDCSAQLVMLARKS